MLYGIECERRIDVKLQNFVDMYAYNAYFYRVLAKNKGIMLLQDPVELQKYVIKIDKKSKVQMIDNSSNEKLSV